MSRSRPKARSTTPLYCGVCAGVRSCLMPDSLRRDWNCPSNSPPPSVRMMPILRPAGAKCVEKMSLISAVASLFRLRKRMILKRLKSSTHSIANLLPAKEVSWKGPAMSTNNRPARLSARLSVILGTAYRRTLASEHCTHGLHAPVSRNPTVRAVPRVMSSLGCPRSWWNSMMSRVFRLAATSDLAGAGFSRSL